MSLIISDDQLPDVELLLLHPFRPKPFEKVSKVRWIWQREQHLNMERNVDGENESPYQKVPGSNPGPAPSSCVTWYPLLNLSVSQYPHL